MTLPDIKAAFITELRAQTDITALTSTRIGSVHRKAWGAEPGYMILVKLNGSPTAAEWQEIGFQATRLDVEFYGSDPDSANHLWQVAHPLIVPTPGAAKLHAFTRENCRVVKVDQEAGPFEILDPVTKLYFTFMSYVAIWAEIAVA